MLSYAQEYTIMCTNSRNSTREDQPVGPTYLTITVLGGSFSLLNRRDCNRKSSPSNMLQTDVIHHTIRLQHPLNIKANGGFYTTQTLREPIK